MSPLEAIFFSAWAPSFRYTKILAPALGDDSTEHDGHEMED